MKTNPKKISRATPGPWIANAPELARTYIRGPNGYAVATVYGAGTGDKFVMEANARLVAASPDLLEAAKIGEKSLAGIALQYPGDVYIGTKLATIRAAIAKVEGDA